MTSTVPALTLSRNLDPKPKIKITITIKRFAATLAALLSALWIVAAICPTAHSQVVVGQAVPNAPTEGAVLSGNLLQFLDGSSLHGSLRGFEGTNIVRWQHPDARQPIAFATTNIDSIRFDNSKVVAPSAQASCRFQFNNGDEFLGNLISLERDSVTLDAWFGKTLKVPRNTLQSVTFLSRSFRLIYEGPTSPEGWEFGKGGQGWQYRDGAFLSKSVGTVGRNFKLPQACSFEFDISWSGEFRLALPFYTEVIDRADYSVGSYLFYFTPTMVTLQRVHTEMGVMNLRAVAIPNPYKKSSYHVEIRANRDESILAVLIDGVLINKWKDDAGFSGKGGGAVFYSQHEGPTVKVSNIRVSEWDGKFDDERPGESKSADDVLHLVNRDKVSGQLGALRDGKLAITTPETPLEIPVQRVSQIYFSGGDTNAVHPPSEVRGLFAGGEKISFQLEKWDEHEIAGTSARLGKVSFTAASIRQLQFNLAQPKAPAEAPAEEEWDGSGSPSLVSFNDKDDAVLFRNGDLLYGGVHSLDPILGLRLARPDSAELMRFDPPGISEIRLHWQTNALAPNDCRIQLSNGDQIDGHLSGITADKVSFETSYAGKLELDRKYVAMIAPLIAQHSVFEGPTGMDGWTMGKVVGQPDAGEWKYRNGAFVATKAAAIARDLKLPDVASIEFDLAWKGTLNMAIALYTTRLQPIQLNTKDAEPDFGGFYSLRLESFQTVLMMVKKGAELKNIWQPFQVPIFTQTNSAHVEIRASKPRRAIALLVNGTLIKGGEDADGFAGTGTAMRFVHQGLGSLKLSNLRISEWDGQFDERFSNTKGAEDLTKLRNADRVIGNVESYREGKFSIATESSRLEVPFERVKQIELAGKKLQPVKDQRSETTAVFKNGRSLNLHIEHWDDKGILVKSPVFGRTLLNASAFSRILFKAPEETK